MPWTKRQKAIFARACSAAGLTDDQRRMALSPFSHAVHEGKVTSTSPRLNNDDFANAMAGVEAWSNGRIKVGGPKGDGYEAGHWAKQAADSLHRMRGLVHRFASKLEVHGALIGTGTGDGPGLKGWIYARVAKERTDDITQLSYHELHALINGLRALARRHNIDLNEGG